MTGNALSDFLTLPVILGVTAVVVFAIGFAALLRIGLGKENDGRTIPM